MLEIYILESEPNHLKFLEETIKELIVNDELDMRIKCYTSNAERFKLETKNSFLKGVYFIDADLITKESIELMKGSNFNRFTVFMSLDSDKYSLTMEYIYGVLGYIINSLCPNLNERIKYLLLLAQKRIKDEKLSMNQPPKPKIAQVWHGIDIKDIILFKMNELNEHKVNLYTQNKIIDFYGSLSEIEKALDDRFVRINRRTIVNAQLISKYDYMF